MRRPNRPLMRSQQPAFQQRSGPVSQGQQVFSSLGGFPDHRMDVSQGSQLTIASPIVCAHHAAWLHGCLDRSRETLCRSIGHATQPDSPETTFVFLGGDHHQSLARGAATALTRLFAANVGFINLNGTGQPVTAWPHHGYPKFLQPDPSSFIAWQAQNPLQSQRTDTIFLAGNMPNGSKPQPQWLPGVLEDGSRGDRDLRIALATAIQASLGLPGFIIATSRTRKPRRPPQLKQLSTAGLFRSKPLFEFQDGSGIIFNFHQPLYYI
jgi:hypothetical protein